MGRTAPNQIELSSDSIKVVFKLQTEVESYTDRKSGLTVYFTGNYSSYKNAIKAKNELVKKGFIDPFIIVIYKGRIISVKEYDRQKKE